ncbi:hypothetical protein [Ralstonia chuxiongensis]|uniref:hypothetical protein n=1 Tax=Ralstonia chuxiongensis TaxID=2957504 RepID=UPI0028F5BA11|nr:hypothetical protein [Ralstonia chuxiongensis]CAJ0785018.1 hypothetical protein R8510_05330 [Ralstonia chuxiongensis]
MNRPALSSEGGCPVSRAALWFGVLAPPLAWSAHALCSYLVASRLCGSGDAGSAAAGLRYALSTPFLLVTAVTLAVALAGAWVGHRNWERISEARRDSSREMNAIWLERSRFLARCAKINGIVFLGAFAFTILSLVVAPLCPG